ncbi:MAG: EamA family transporter [Bryobacteraceae bacterium]
MTWLLVSLVVSATTASEVLRAMGMRRHGEIDDFGPRALGRSLAAVARNRFVLASIALSAIAFFSLLTLLSMADLSFAIPATAASFALETILAKYVLKERVGAARWMGATLVASGVALLSL